MSFLKKLFGQQPKEKTRLSLFRGLFSSAISYIISVSESPSEANKILKDMGREAGKLLFQKYLEVGEFHEELEKIPENYDFAYDVFVGVDFDDIWYVIPESREYFEVHFRIYDNPTSKRISSPNPEIKVDNFMAGVIEWISQLLEDDLNTEKITCNEIECKAAGDDYCEYVLKFEWAQEMAHKTLKKFDIGTHTVKESKTPHQ